MPGKGLIVNARMVPEFVGTGNPNAMKSANEGHPVATTMMPELSQPKADDGAEGSAEPDESPQ